MTQSHGPRRYFFGTTIDLEKLSFDTEGVELIDDQDARRHALAALPDMAMENISNGDNRTFRVSVKNECGGTIYRASLVLRGEWLSAKEK